MELGARLLPPERHASAVRAWVARIDKESCHCEERGDEAISLNKHERTKVRI
jgi:hypothetical protein